MIRTLTIKGKRYQVSARGYDDCLNISGPGIVGGIAIAGVSLDAPDLRDRIIAELAAYEERRCAASEYIREQMRKGLV